MKYCSACGKEVLDTAVICPHCGSNIGIIYNTKKKDKLAAALLGIFLGFFGVNWFYLGRVMPGVLSLLFCFTGIPVIVNFIHGIILLLSSEEDFDLKYNKTKNYIIL